MPRKRTTTEILPVLIGATMLCTPTYALADDEESSQVLEQKKVEVEQQIEVTKLKIEQMQQLMDEAVVLRASGYRNSAYSRTAIFSECEN